ncbi:hypothetical protein HDV00_010815 [Rhizophlyctis rosea]|nr:hypothetical protein HDV00_010815 [Rhizophlyctis rosea]
MSLSSSHAATPQPLLLLTGPTWPAIDFHRPPLTSEIGQKDRFTINNRPLFVDFRDGKDQVEGDTEEGLSHEVKTAFTVWDCSLILAKYLEYQSVGGAGVHNVKGKRVVELGSGRGLVGMSAACLGANVTLTDVDTVVPTLHHVLKVNDISLKKEIQPYHADSSVVSAQCSGTVDNVVGLDWTRRDEVIPSLTPPNFDFILAADVVWVEDLILPLAKTIQALTSSKTITLLAYQSRSTRADRLLAKAIEECGLVSRIIDRDELDPVFRKDAVVIFEIRLGGRDEL